MGLKITTIDSNGVKTRALNKAEFGYDAHTDIGRVSIGTEAGVDIPLAKLSEVTAKLDKSVYDAMGFDRADIVLAGQNIANMLYTDGNLTKIRYTDNTDTDYETFDYIGGNLSSINHYIGSVLKGTTTLSYTDGNLVSAIFVEV